jgi:chromosomal replication initiation ATPase DnaA
MLSSLLSTASLISSKLPSKDDSLLTRCIKYLSILDSLKGPKSSRLFSFCKKHNLKLLSNDLFVDLFFSTKLKSTFSLSTFKVEENTEINKASHPSWGDLFFIEYTYGSRPEVSQDFYHSKNFNFQEALNFVWSSFNNRIHLEVSPLPNGRSKSHFSTLSHSPQTFFGNSPFFSLKSQFETFQSKGIPRTILLYGKQGVGKTSFCLALATSNQKVLRIDSSNFSSCSTAELDFLLTALQPDFLLIDDIDRAKDLASFFPTLFTTLSDFKSKYPSTSLFLTANNVDSLDPAFLRPGRIDQLIEIPTPSTEDREAILKGFLKNPSNLNQLTEASEGLSASYLKEIALQDSLFSLEYVLNSISSMKKFS